jgi:hypothetical protein
MVNSFWSGVSGRTNPDGFDQSLELKPNSILSQNFVTQVGQTYELSFWYAHDCLIPDIRFKLNLYTLPFRDLLRSRILQLSGAEDLDDFIEDDEPDDSGEDYRNEDWD